VNGLRRRRELATRELAVEDRITQFLSLPAAPRLRADPERPNCRSDRLRIEKSPRK
jgi:hypothetical protein